jgi:TonB-dependent starch-binding outer membrane protein SusC
MKEIYLLKQTLLTAVFAGKILPFRKNTVMLFLGITCCFLGSLSFSYGSISPGARDEAKDRFNGNSAGLNSTADMQQVRMTGTITDENGNPLPGVNVQVEGTTIGTISDISGKYSIDLPGRNVVLIFTFVGYTPQKVPVEGKTTINVQLQTTISQLDEVVVVGYGTQKKSDLTGSVVRVNMAEKLSANNVNLLQAIQGDTPGLNVTGGNAAAGDEPSLSVRGRTSLSASDNPLIVIDGVIFNGSLSDINVNDVESIDVLKDASAAAVYGSRSANGVMIVTTKKGKTDKPRFTLTSTYGVQDFTKYLPVMNAEEFAIRLVDYNWEQQLYAWYAKKPTSPSDQGGRPARADVSNRTAVASYLRTQEEKDNYLKGGYDIDWIDAVTRTAPMMMFDLGISGKTDKTNYYFSGSYTDQKGVLRNDQFNRTTVHSNIESKMTDWLTLGLNTDYSYRDYSGLETGFDYARRASPLANSLDANGNYQMILATETYQIHPLGNLLADNYDVRNNLFVIGTAKITIPQVKGLSYNVNYSNTFYTQRQNTFYPKTIYAGSTNNGDARRNDSEERNWLLDNIVTYARDFGMNHRVNVTLLYSRENRTGQNSNITTTGFGNGILGYNAVQLGTLPTVSSGSWEENSVSYMARANYVFRNRYMITGTFRKDGYSGFGASKKYANFPSLSLAWVASEENFVKSLGEWLNTLKIRLSYGANGNQGIGRYSSFSRMATSSYVFGSTTSIGVYPNTMGNENLGWETTNSLNLGIDYGVLSQRISGSVDIYTAQTSNVLVQRTLPTTTGYTSVWTNIGGIANKGIEIALTTVNILKPLKWESRFSFSLNRDEITKLYGGKEDKDIGNSWFIGEPISAIYEYTRTGGVWTEQELYAGKIPVAGFLPGHLRLADLNGDGQVEPNYDRSIIGYQTPNFRWSLGNTLSYRNFTLSIFLNSIMGGNGYYLGNTAALVLHSITTPVSGSGRNTEDTPRVNQYNIYPYWTPDNGVTNMPGIYYAPPREPGYWESRSFVRLQDINLTYSFGKKVLNALKMAGCDIFVSGKNLYTWTNWSGWDPETASNNLPIMKSMTGGIRITW